MIKNVRKVPIQITDPFSNWGVTLIVANTGVLPLFIAVNEGISPVPPEPRPILVLSLVQVYVVTPEVLLVVKVTDVNEPLHTTWLPGGFISPEGFTVIVKVCDGPIHETPPLMNNGVTTIVDITGEVPVLMAMNEDMSPVPLAARPMLVVLLVQA